MYSFHKQDKIFASNLYGRLQWLAIVNAHKDLLLMFYLLLKMTYIKLGLMTDVDMYQFIDKGLCGGISYIANRYGQANINYMKTYDEKAPSNYIMYRLCKSNESEFRRNFAIFGRRRIFGDISMKSQRNYCSHIIAISCRCAKFRMAFGSKFRLGK